MTRFCELLDGIGSLLFPAGCIGCQIPLEVSWRQPQAPLCAGCLKSLPWLKSAGPHQKLSRHFDQAISVCSYEGLAKELLHAFKYEKQISIGRFLGGLVSRAVQEQAAEPVDGVAAVPLHPTRLRERTFNQAEVLAAQVASDLKYPLFKGLLFRHRATPPQTSLSRQDRLRNVEEAFELLPNPLIRSLHLVLIDDVFTTGATAEACAKVLKRHGVAQVTLASFAQG